MTNDLDTSRSTGDRRRSRAYLLEFVPSMIAYVVVLMLVTRFGGLDGTNPWRFLWALLPVLPVTAIAIAVLRQARRVDDYQRQQLLASVAAGFAAAMLTAVTVGFLNDAGLGIPRVGWWIFGAGMATWLVAALVLRRR